MNLKEAAAVAKQQVSDLYAPDVPRQLRLEEFVYDDHLGVWSLTIGFALPQDVQEASSAPPGRNYKIVRVSEASKSVLSVKDR